MSDLKFRLAKLIMSAHGEPVPVRYDECGDVRFSALDGDGHRFNWVLLYAVGRDDGLYEVGSTLAELFDRGVRDIGLGVGFLDRIPSDGEFVDDWFTGYCRNDVDVAMDRGYRFLRDNGLDGFVKGMTYTGWPLD